MSILLVADTTTATTYDTTAATGKYYTINVGLFSLLGFLDILD